MTLPTAIAPLLERNRLFAATGAHQGLGGKPAFAAVLVCCLDPRVEPAVVLGLQLGEVLVLRNAGGRATDAVLADLAFLSFMFEQNQPTGQLFEVAVLQHTGCGSAALANPTIRQRLAQRTGLDDATLAKQAIVDPTDSVRTDVARIIDASQLSSRIEVSGHVYDIATGLVTTIIPATARHSKPTPRDSAT